MKLSVLIPMYNVEDYIANCLESVINQNIPSNEYEIIIIDDGSTDNSKNIAEEYAKKHRNISLHSQTNIGLYATRNRLLKLANGDYIYNLDSDDYIVYNSFNTILNTAIEKNVDILGFDSISTKKKDIYKAQKEVVTLNAIVESGNNFLSQNIKYPNTVWWYIIKQDFIIDNTLKFDENNPLGDGPFTLRALHLTKKMLYLPLDIHRYVKVSNSITNNNNKEHLINMIKNYRIIFDRYNLLADEVSKSNENNTIETLNIVKHWRDVNVYMMFYTIIKSDITINEIDKILEELKEVGIYPIKYFIGKRYHSLKHKTIIYIFNHKTIFYSILYPLRVFYCMISNLS